MPRSYEELLSDDPAWPDLAKKAAAAPNDVVVLPPASDAQRRACLEALQMTTRSTLGALAHETGGVLVDHGFMRMLGSGSPRLSRQLIAWNAEVGIDLDRYIIVADDVIGGVFAIDGTRGALGPEPGALYYFAPDTLGWEEADMRHTEFVEWAFQGNLEDFYESMRWSGWREEVAATAADLALSFDPPLWSTGEGSPLAERRRSAVPAKELWDLRQRLSKKRGRK